MGTIGEQINRDIDQAWRALNGAISALDPESVAELG